jgi:histidinol-phosphate aminotransferase
MSYEREAVRLMQGYSWGEQPQDERVLKLNTNENPYPPSPAVQRALAAFDAATLRRYPQPTADMFRDLAATRFSLERGNVLVTNGGDELLRLAFTTFLNPGDAVGMAQPGYSLYPVLAAIHDCPMQAVPLNDDWSLPEDFGRRMNAAGVKLTCIVCPHAPSGVLTPVEHLASLARELNGVLVIDEAYVDFVDPEIGHDATSLVRRFDNVLLLRTLSKGYSLAGLRFGFGLAQASLIEPMLTKTRDSYNMDALSQTLGCAAFNDQQYAAGTWARVRDERCHLHAELAGRGFSAPVSQTNFLLASAPEHSRLVAREIYLGLKQRGILVRHFDAPRMEDKLRITVGDRSQNDRLLAALDEIAAQ